MVGPKDLFDALTDYEVVIDDKNLFDGHEGINVEQDA
jgi:hypothetical protein